MLQEWRKHFRHSFICKILQLNNVQSPHCYSQMKIWTGEGRSRWQRCRHTAKNSSSQNSSEQVRALAVQCGDNSGSSEWVGRKIDCPSPVLPPARGFEFCWALKGLNVRVIWKAGLITGDKWGCLSSWEWKEEKAEKVKSWDPIVRGLGNCPCDGCVWGNLQLAGLGKVEELGRTRAPVVGPPLQIWACSIRRARW